MKRSLFTLFLLSLLLALPSYAASPFVSERTISVGNGKMLEVGRPISLVGPSDIVYTMARPHHDEVAILNKIVDNGGDPNVQWKVYLLDLTTLKRQQIFPRSAPLTGAPADDLANGAIDAEKYTVGICCWDSLDRYLICSVEDKTSGDFKFYRVDGETVPAAVDLVPSPGRLELNIGHLWSPDFTHLMLLAPYRDSNGQTDTTSATGKKTFILYEIATGKEQAISVPANYAYYGWLGNHGVQFSLPGKTTNPYVYYDFVTGGQTKTPCGTLSADPMGFPLELSNQNPKYPKLYLQSDLAKVTGGPVTMDGISIWMQHGDGNRPLEKAAIGGGQISDPASGYSSTWALGGSAIVYSIDGTVFFCELIERDATDEERLVLKLPVSAEQLVAMAKFRAQIIGAFLNEYRQGNDKFPSKGDFEGALLNYRGDHGYSSIGATHFQYIPPTAAQLASADLSQVKVGEFNLKTSRVILFGDGHVETRP